MCVRNILQTLTAQSLVSTALDWLVTDSLSTLLCSYLSFSLSSSHLPVIPSLLFLRPPTLHTPRILIQECSSNSHSISSFPYLLSSLHPSQGIFLGVQPASCIVDLFPHISPNVPFVSSVFHPFRVALNLSIFVVPSPWYHVLISLAFPLGRECTQSGVSSTSSGVENLFTGIQCSCLAIVN